MIILILLLLIVVALIVGVIVQQFLTRKKTGLTPYTEGLALLLDGRKDEAIPKLRQTVLADTDNVDAYLRLAELYFEKGELDRALQIQRALMARRGLHRDQEQKIYTSLGRSYRTTGQTERAILIYEELIKLGKKNLGDYEILLELYCKAERWEECATLLKQLSKLQKDRHRLALYCSEAGRHLLKKSTGDGIDYLRRALKIDSKCAAALFSLGYLYYQQADFNQAIEYWRQLLENTPHYSFLVLEYLQRAYLDAGRFSQIIPVFEKLLKKQPNEPAFYLALAQIYEKKGESSKAIDLLRKATEVKTGAFVPWLELITIQLRSGEIDKSIKDLEGITKRLDPKRFQCMVCRFQSPEFLWHCPNCHSWETFIR